MQVGHDLGHRGVVDDLTTLRLHRRSALLPASPQGGVLGAEAQPARLVQRPRRHLSMVVHEAVELLDVSDDVVHPQRREGLARVRPAASGEAAHVAEKVQHEQTDPGRIVTQPRRRGTYLANPVAEDLHP